MTTLCEVCFFPTTTFERPSRLGAWFTYRCVHCDALDCESVYLLEQHRRLKGALWANSILTFVQSPNSKGGTYCEFQTLV